MRIGKEVDVVIPSAGRPRNVTRMQQLLPFARWCVPAKQRTSYSRVPDEMMFTHPDRVHGMAGKRQWILDHSKAPVVFFCDDDLKDVRCLIGRRTRKVVEPGAIGRIIEVTAVAAADAGVSGFGFGRIANPAHIQPNRFISFTHPLAGAFGIIGRKHRFDKRLTSREDIDVTLSMLLTDRIVWVDVRWYWNFAGTWDAAGGLQDVRTEASDEADKALLKKKWGGAISFKAKGMYGRKCPRRGSMSVVVCRK